MVNVREITTPMRIPYLVGQAAYDDANPSASALSNTHNVAEATQRAMYIYAAHQTTMTSSLLSAYPPRESKLHY